MTSLIDSLEQENGKSHLPPVRVGDTVEVHYLIREGDKERVQLFIGTVIRINGRGIRKAIVVRRIVQGEGVERSFPLHSPRVKDVTVARRGNVRRSKLYYLRDRVGKATRVTEKLGEKARRDKDRDAAFRAEMEAAAAAQAAAAEGGEGGEG
ncbi:50S ribosomal protein L19 [Planctomycetes bacterium Pla86]|uniref:Large ribosomal subunit protein bL19 n=1 Tax=Engelhardtia mirabilis TaxID=2528011 RepID=A0A518BPG7_9BACT|nr:50S ribosomal protein L19 [Planctomycetes bacterium Pla133]QDV03201.1 50S ribosomal protein L19 [Planctomycetes bacterium Pla86]